MWCRCRRGLWILALAGALVPEVALANPFDLFGYNPRALSMGSSHTAFADDFTAVYYNPAALTAARDLGFGIGFMAARPNLRLRFDRQERLIPDLEPPNADGITFGALFPLGGPAFRNRIALGVGVNVPTRSVLNGQALDPAIPHWYMYQSLPSRLVLMLGLGVMPFEWLSLGAGVQVLAGVQGSLDYELDIVAGRFSRKTVLFDIEPQASPLLGLEVRPLSGLRLGFVYRTSIESPIDLPVDLEITGIARLLVLTAFRVQYTPHQLAWGASYRFDSIGLSASADLTWALWSHAPDPSVASSLDVSGDLFDGTGLGGVFDAPSEGQERAVDLAFRDVLIPRIGVEQVLGPVALRAGYALRPSPAPLQTTGTNYVDATAHEIGLGAGVRFRDPLEAFANPLIIDVGAALKVVPKRQYTKVDAQDPVGGYAASGTVLVLGVALRYEFQEAASSDRGPTVEIRTSDASPATRAPEDAAPRSEPTTEPPPEDDRPEGDAQPQDGPRS